MEIVLRHQVDRPLSYAGLNLPDEWPAGVGDGVVQASVAHFELGVGHHINRVEHLDAEYDKSLSDF